MNSNPEIYGFAERREAEGSEDFDSIVHENLYQREHKSPAVAGYPQYSSPSSQTTNTAGKNVHFEAFSAPTSPYNHQYAVQYKPPIRYGQPISEKVSYCCFAVLVLILQEIHRFIFKGFSPRAA